MKNKVPKEPKQYVNKPLQLNSVPKSEDSSDNILVQGADKTVKFISRDELNTAEQVNTDWNSESGLSQLLNKPEFKTINGESVLGNGDITFQESEVQNLDQVLTEGNSTDKTITLFINGANPAAATSVHSLTPYYDIIENRQVNMKSTQFANAYKIENTTAPFDQITYQDHFIGMVKDGMSNITYFPSYTNDNGNSAFFPVSVNGKFADEHGNIEIEHNNGNLDFTLGFGNSSNKNIVLYDAGSSAETASLTNTFTATNHTIKNDFTQREFKTFSNGIQLTNTQGAVPIRTSFGEYGISHGTINQEINDVADGINFVFPSIVDIGDTTHYMPVSVNGEFADSTGNIDITTASETPNLQQITDIGNITDKKIVVEGVEIGKGAGTGTYNVAIGSNSLSTNTTGFQNTAVGNKSLYYNTTGFSNIAIGSESLYDNTKGSCNVAIGLTSLRNNTTANYNTAVGYCSLRSNITGNVNTAIGYNSLFYNNGPGNTAVGGQSLYYNNTGYYNTALGSSCLYSNTSGYYNTALGINSSYSNTTGYYNIAIGYDSLRKNTTGNSNIAIGNNSLYDNFNGDGNIVLGNNSAKGIKTGKNNTIIGSSFPFFFNADDSNLVVLGDGQGKIAIRKEADNRLLAPTLTNTLIDLGGNKSLITKEYIDSKIGVSAPTSSSDAGMAGDIRVSDGYIYWYVSGTGWLRAAGTTF